jgi:hypothetical protein
VKNHIIHAFKSKSGENLLCLYKLIDSVIESGILIRSTPRASFYEGRAQNLETQERQ